MQPSKHGDAKMGTADEATRRLRELGAAATNAPIAKRIKEVLPDIESALARGVSHEKIVEELQLAGLPVALGTFRTTLYRLRRKQEKAAAKEERKPPLSQAKTQPQPKPKEGNERPAHPGEFREQTRQARAAAQAMFTNPMFRKAEGS